MQHIKLRTKGYQRHDQKGKFPIFEAVWSRPDSFATASTGTVSRFLCRRRKTSSAQFALGNDRSRAIYALSAVRYVAPRVFRVGGSSTSRVSSVGSMAGVSGDYAAFEESVVTIQDNICSCSIPLILRTQKQRISTTSERIGRGN